MKTSTYQIDLALFPSAEHVDPTRMIHQNVVERLDELRYRDLIDAIPALVRQSIRQLVSGLTLSPVVHF